MKKITPTIGWIGLALGIIVAVSAPLPGYGIFIALFGMLPGFICSSIYVLFSTRYQLPHPKWINPGLVGMLLNSTPLIMFIYFSISK
jgi:hypothetical protein